MTIVEVIISTDESLDTIRDVVDDIENKIVGHLNYNSMHINIDEGL